MKFDGEVGHGGSKYVLDVQEEGRGEGRGALILDSHGKIKAE